MLHKIRFKYKLLLLILIPLLGLGYFAISNIYQSYNSYSTVSRLEKFARLSVSIGDLVHETQKERGYTAVYLFSNGEELRAELQQQRISTNKTVDAIRNFLLDFDADTYSRKLSSDIKKAITELDNLQARRGQVLALSISTEEAFSYYTNMNASFLGVLAEISKISKEVRVSYRTTAYLNFLLAKEQAGIERALLANVFKADQFDKDSYYKVVKTTTAQEMYFNLFKLFTEQEYLEAYNEFLESEAAFESLRLRQLALKKRDEGGFAVDVKTWFQLMTEKINSLKKIEESLSNDIIKTAQNITVKEKQNLWVYALILIACLLITGFISRIIIVEISNILGGDPKEVTEIAALIVAEKELGALNIEKDRIGLYGLMVEMYSTFSEKSKDLTRSIAISEEALAKADYSTKLSAAVIETAPDAIFTVGEDHLIITANESSLKMFGYSKVELIGQNIKLITPDHVSEQHDSYVKSYIKTGNKKIIGKSRMDFGRKRDGTLFPILMKLSETEIKGQKIFAGIIRDMTVEVEQQKEIETRSKEIEGQNWLKTAQNNILESTKGLSNLSDYLSALITQIAKELNAAVGTFYLNEALLLNNTNELKLYASYAYTKRKGDKLAFKFGEGLVGQCALEKKRIILTEIPEDYIEVVSGTGKTAPTEIMLIPILHENKVVGVVELAILRSFNELEMKLLDTTSASLGGMVNGAIERVRIEALSREVNNQIEAINRSNAAIELDMEGIILAANNQFLELMGYTLEEIKGKHHSIFVSEEYKQSKEYKTFWATLSAGSFLQGEFKRHSKSGDIVWINGSYNPLLDAEEKPYKVLKIATDITEQKNLQFELQKQKEKLEAQEEELRVSNDELLKQAQQLQSSEEELRVQQEELAYVNAELEEKATELEEQNQRMIERNEALEQTKQALDLKAAELEKSGTYKSEFLANMSHELRTPLNSILILSKLLSENKNSNLSAKQIEYSEVIYKSGSDLLNLINEVLDLAKVESGKMELELERLDVADLAADFEKSFFAIAKDKEINFKVTVDPAVPEAIATDKMRLQQIVKNLISNAFKFTGKSGDVNLSFQLSKALPFMTNFSLINANAIIAISCKDTGIGIPEDKISTVFEAFKQADGSTQRKYGGTGLGLSITKELSKLLGGEIHLESELGKGSTFTLYLPVDGPIDMSVDEMKSEIKDRMIELAKLDETNAQIEQTQNLENSTIEKKKLEAVIVDDRDDIVPGDQVLLIVEDDLTFANVLLSIAKEKGFKVIVTDQGDKALEHVEVYLPSAIILDMKLPVMDGWTVLKKLKASKFSGIPVHVMSGMDKKKLGLEMGAVEYLVKPIPQEVLEATFNSISNHLDKQKIDRVLVIEDDENQNIAIEALLSKKEIRTTPVKTGKAGIEQLRSGDFQMVVLDLGLPDMEGLEVLRQLKKIKPSIPVIVFTGRELSAKQVQEIEKLGDTSIVIKTAKSYDRILEETELFIHLLKNPRNKEKLIVKDFDKLDILNGKTILLVDDDMRNIFSLETVLESEGIICQVATNGLEALEAVKSGVKFDAILMDIMMPEMDGYEATQKIREMGFDKLPIIALTAKAMKGDREKCFEAGVSDYMTKPIDVNQLLSLLRVWLYK